MLRQLYKNIRAKQQSKQPVTSRRRMQFETLEPRILLSADLGIEQPRAAAQAEMLPAQHADLDDGGHADQQTTAAAAAAGAAKVELIVVDGALTDPQSLIAGLQAQNGVSYEIHTLDSQSDGMAQVTALLQDRSDISAIHLFSHGSSGHLTLGSTTFGTDCLARYGADLAIWGQALTTDGDILL